MTKRRARRDDKKDTDDANERDPGNTCRITTRLTFPPPQYIIDASQPASDKIFDVAAFEKFLQDRIKVEGRTNNLGDSVVVQQQGEGKIEVIAHNDLSGRYLKYLWVLPLGACA